ncbi:uncharacterized protein LOC126576808 [Anopheles aquasalis]|uniref:uncharacterized protein LOC126576808 n=1 Tax=Anopheles aquasalis TaxID=42839 RepID=UPI00215AE141|nr:uncharacterized protein LOC126576808 [Anopheles aquasalis]
MGAGECCSRRGVLLLLFLLFTVGKVLSSLMQFPRQRHYPLLHSVSEDLDERFFRDLPADINGLTIMTTMAQRLTIRSTLPLEYLGVRNAQKLGKLVIEPNEQLAYLELSGCPLPSWDPSLNNLTGLIGLRLSCQLSGTLDLAVFSVFPMLMILQLDQNQLDRVVFTQWPNWTGPVELSLTELYLQDNSLTHLDGTVFEPFRNLRELILSSNRLERQLEIGVPVQLPKLEKLDLSHNRLTEVDFRDWQCPELRTVQLNCNQLTSFPRFGIGFTSALRMLTLSFNRLTTVDEGQMSLLRNLQLLNLDGNNIHHWPGASIDTELPQLLGLHLSVNPLETVNFHRWHMPRLQTLYLSSDTLRTISDDLFDRYPLLDEVRAYCRRLDCGWIERHQPYIERRILKVVQIGTYKVATDYNCTNRPVCYACLRYDE